MEKAIEQQLVEAAKVVENQLDSEIKKLDNLDEDELENLRRKRLGDMKKQQELRDQWRQQGHGSYSEIVDEKEFFDVCKKSTRVVCHFYRDETFRCRIVDQHLSVLAGSHNETKFIKINAEKSPFLTQRLKIRVLPTIALIKDAKTKDFIVGFDDLGGRDDFSTEVLEWRIARAEAIFYSGDLLNAPGSQERQQATAQSLFQQQKKKTIKGKLNDSSSDDDDD